MRLLNLLKLMIRFWNYFEGVLILFYEIFKFFVFYVCVLVWGEFNVVIWIVESLEFFCCFFVILVLFGWMKIIIKNVCKEMLDK